METVSDPAASPSRAWAETEALGPSADLQLSQLVVLTSIRPVPQYRGSIGLRSKDGKTLQTPGGILAMLLPGKVSPPKAVFIV